ncbi:exodeoxyribonuclease III [Deinococcus sp.]|uniref:exodeoxyribonuclease III n=1 Tax=Deinococcus sp. TaxID=47478 RepID=UPI003CC5E896
MHVVTLNLNGLRSAIKKGLPDWIALHSPDVLLLQEVRADPMPEVFWALGYHSVWHPAQRPGYSGVAIASREPLEGLQTGFGDEPLDAEGRLISGVIGAVRYASLYLPSGARGERQDFKDRSLPLLSAWTAQAMRRGPLVLGGDFNVAHTELDIKNWRSNQRSSGFLPHERAWMTGLLASGLHDNHRAALGQESAYTWWSNRAGAYANDVGWRIDYLLSSGVQMRDVQAHRAARLSDHAPISATVAFVLD